MSTPVNKEAFVAELQSTYLFFTNSISVFEEQDSEYRPQDGMLTVAQQVAHTAQTVDWFFEGAFRPEGFDMNLESHWEKVTPITSLRTASRWLAQSFDAGSALIETKSVEDWFTTLPEGPVMGGAPRLAIIGGITDHSAHHRGALTVYARLLGKISPMPYGPVA